MPNDFRDSLPDELVTHVTAICGQAGEVWFEELSATITALERKWSLKIEEPFCGIEFNFVAPALIDEARPSVVKIAPPFERTEIHAEAKYLRTLDGAGAVRLLAEDREMRALLIERALPGDSLVECFANDPAAAVAPAIEVLRMILRQPPASMTDVQSLDTWFNNFRRCGDTDFPGDRAEKAFEIYERLSKQTGRAYYLHGDFHLGNIVRSHRAPFLAIDPKGLVGHVGYDIAVFLVNLFRWQEKNANVEELLAWAVRQFADAFTLTETEVREWTYAYMVIGAWWNFEDMPELYDADVAMTDIWGV